MSLDLTDVTKIIKNSQRLGRIKQAMGSLKYYVSREPKLQPPKGRAEYESIGAQIGINGYELELIINAVLNDPDENELAVIKQLAFIGKLKHQAPTLQYREAIERAQERFDAEMRTYTESLAKHDKLKEELETLLKQDEFADMQASWEKLIVDLQLYVEFHNYKVKFFTGDEAAFWTLLRNSSKWVREEYNETNEVIAVIDWEKVKHLNLEHISTILRKWIGIKEQKR